MADAGFRSSVTRGCDGSGACRAEELTILVHLINHLLQLLRCGVLAQHPHHLAQLLGADAAILSAEYEDVKGCLELCVRWSGGGKQSGQGSAARTPKGKTPQVCAQRPICPLPSEPLRSQREGPQLLFSSLGSSCSHSPALLFPYMCVGVLTIFLLFCQLLYLERKRGLRTQAPGFSCC